MRINPAGKSPSGTYRSAGISSGLFVFALLLLAFVEAGSSETAGQEHVSWSDYLGNSDSAQYSGLEQINKSNVKNLRLEAFVPAGGNNAEFGFNPVAVGNVMYVLGKNDAVTAVEMTTGRTIWSHEVKTDLMIGRGMNSIATP